MTVLGVSPALALDAATFVVSALVLRLGLPEHRAEGVPTTGPGLRGVVAGTREAVARIGQGARVVGGDARLRSLIALACVSAFVVTVEGLAAPYAAHLGAGPAAVGFLLAANPLGAAVGIVLLTRLVAPDARGRLLGPLAVGSCLPLVGSALDPPLPVVMGLWVLSGLCCAYQVPANAAFVAAVTDAHRGQAFGLAVTALRVTQGLGVLLAGLLAQETSPPRAVAISGVVGAATALVAAGAWRRARRATRASVADEHGARRDPGFRLLLGRDDGHPGRRMSGRPGVPRAPERAEQRRSAPVSASARRASGRRAPSGSRRRGRGRRTGPSASRRGPSASRRWCAWECSFVVAPRVRAWRCHPRHGVPDGYGCHAA